MVSATGFMVSVMTLITGRSVPIGTVSISLALAMFTAEALVGLEVWLIQAVAALAYRTMPLNGSTMLSTVWVAAPTWRSYAAGEGEAVP